MKVKLNGNIYYAAQVKLPLVDFKATWPAKEPERVIQVIRYEGGALFELCERDYGEEYYRKLCEDDIEGYSTALNIGRKLLGHWC